MGCPKLTYLEDFDREYRTTRYSHLSIIQDTTQEKQNFQNPQAQSFFSKSLKVCPTDFFKKNENVDGDYRYGYQGSEKDDEVKGKGNSYTTHYRQLDPRLGRWLSVDPKTNELPWESPYVSMGNTPIWANDPMGDKFEKKRDQRKIKRFEKKVNKRLVQVGKQISNEKDENKLEDLNNIKAELESSLVEVKGLKDSEQKIELKKIKSGGYIDQQQKGSDLVEIAYSSFSSLGHELKHADQFLKGRLSLKAFEIGVLYDGKDEEEAYRRQYAIDPERVRVGFERHKIGEVKIKKMTDITAKEIIKHSDYEKLDNKQKTLKNTSKQAVINSGDIIAPEQK